MYLDDIRLNRPFIFGKLYFQKEEHDIHVHDILEIGLVDEQEVSYQFGDRTYLGKQGDIFPFYTEWLPSPVIRAGNPQADMIARSFERAFRSSDRGGNRNEAEQFLCLLEILLQIHEYASDQSQENLELQEVQRIIHAVNYMLQHFAEDVSMDKLMELSGEKRSRFFEKFHSFTGISPNQFLIRLRIQHAMDMLHRFPERSVLHVCEESGFQSLRTFNNQFKSYTGMSPTEYRKISPKYYRVERGG